MRERELKKECIDVAREMKQTQRGREGDETEAESTETVSETKCEEGVLAF